MRSNRNAEEVIRESVANKNKVSVPIETSSSSSSIEFTESQLKTNSSSSVESSMFHDYVSKSSSGMCSSDSQRPPVRPPISYATLITEAIQQSEGKQLILSEIYDYIKEHYPYFRTAGNGWKNSIRHNLSLNKSFCKAPRAQRTGKKGSFWKLADNISGKRKNDIDGLFRRHSLPPLINRPTLPIYPLSGERHKRRAISEGLLKLPPLRPRPIIDPLTTYALPSLIMQELGATQLSSPTHNHLTYQEYLQPEAEWNVLMPPVDITFVMPDAEEFRDINGQKFTEPSESFGSEQIWRQDTVEGSNAQTVYFQDVWLGADTPKDMSSSPFGSACIEELSPVK